jgi:glutathione S-transferase
MLARAAGRTQSCAELGPPGRGGANPRGTRRAVLYGRPGVPAIEHDGNRLYESAVINEYLDEVFHDPASAPPRESFQGFLRQIR